MFKHIKNASELAAASYGRWDKSCGIAIGSIAIVSSLAIMHGDSTLISPEMQRFVAIPNYIAVLYLLVQAAKKSAKTKMYFPLLIAWGVAWGLHCFHVADGVSIHITWLSLAALFLFCMMNKHVWHYAFRIFRLFMVVTAATGIIAWVCYMIGIPPLRITDYYGMSTGLDAIYIIYPFAYLTGGAAGFRLCGLFNEPGMYGTMAALILIAERFNLRDKGNLLILVAGLLSLSFAFLVLVIIFFAVRMIKTPKLLPSIMLVGGIFVFLIVPLISPKSEVGMLLSRLTYDQTESRFTGDNRSNLAFQNYYDYAEKSGKLMTGLGAGAYSSDENVTVSSYMGTIVTHGYMGAITMWGLLFIAIVYFMPKRFDTWLFVICFFASIYQRPGVFECNYMVALFGGVMNLSFLIKEQEKNALYSKSSKKRIQVALASQT